MNKYLIVLLFLSSLLFSFDDFIIKENCKKGDSESCIKLGNIYNQGKLVPVNQSMGLYFYKKSCLYKNAIGCNFAGGMLLYGLGQKEDDFESIKYFEKSCSLGFKPACENYKNLVD